MSFHGIILKRRQIAASLAICFVSSLPARAQTDEEQARKFAEEAINVGAIEYLKDRDFKLDGKEIVATARAIDPNEHVKVKLLKFEMLPGRANVEFRVDARFRFEGKLSADDDATEVRGEADIGQTISLEAKYWIDERRLRIDAKATEIKFRLKVRELSPENAAGGKAAVAKVAVRQLRRQKEELLREFNDWQAKQNARFEDSRSRFAAQSCSGCF